MYTFIAIFTSVFSFYSICRRGGNATDSRNVRMEIQKELQKILSPVRAAVERYGMIEDGDVIAVGVSGGKDSLTMLYALAALREFLPRKFELRALQIDPGFDKSPSIGAEKNTHDGVRALCDTLGVQYHLKES